MAGETLVDRPWPSPAVTAPGSLKASDASFGVLEVLGTNAHSLRCALYTSHGIHGGTRLWLEPRCRGPILSAARPQGGAHLSPLVAGVSLSARGSYLGTPHGVRSTLRYNLAYVTQRMKSWFAVSRCLCQAAPAGHPCLEEELRQRRCWPTTPELNAATLRLRGFSSPTS